MIAPMLGCVAGRRVRGCESHLPELLESSTSIPIRQARDGMEIEPGHVYVTPPDARMGVVNGKLSVGQRPTDKSQYTPIDYFFGAMASYYQERAIAVVLSGTASDGALGLGAVFYIVQWITEPAAMRKEPGAHGAELR